VRQQHEENSRITSPFPSLCYNRRHYAWQASAEGNAYHSSLCTVSRHASHPTCHSALGKTHLPLRYPRRTKFGVLLWALCYLHFLVQKRTKFFMPAWIQWLFSPFLLGKS